jgi:hypothetical protein
MPVLEKSIRPCLKEELKPKGLGLGSIGFPCKQKGPNSIPSTTEKKEEGKGKRECHNKHMKFRGSQGVFQKLIFQ